MFASGQEGTAISLSNPEKKMVQDTSQASWLFLRCVK